MQRQLPIDRRISQFFTRQYVGVDTLAPEEASLIAKAEDRRKQHFCTGRYCARQALKRFVSDQPAILRGRRNQPLWPAGTVGSISHSSVMTGALAAAADDYLGLGLDIEVVGAVKPEMWDSLFLEKEKQFLNRVDNPKDIYATLLFSLKESFYKLQYPLTGIFLEFQHLSIQPAGNSFLFAVDWPGHQPPFAATDVQARWFVEEDQIITVCSLNNRR